MITKSRIARQVSSVSSYQCISMSNDLMYLLCSEHLPVTVTPVVYLVILETVTHSHKKTREIVLSTL